MMRSRRAQVIIAITIGLFIHNANADPITTVADKSILWTRDDSLATKHLNHVAWGGDCFVAVGDDCFIFMSKDGLTWKQVYSGRGIALACVEWIFGQFFAVGQSGTLLTSPNGIAWTEQKPFATQDLNCVAAGANKAVIGGENGTMLFSKDGKDWIKVDTNTDASFLDVCWNGTMFAASTNSGAVLLSADGISWESVSVGDKKYTHLYGITWNGKEFAAIDPAAGGGIVYRSSDGKAWTETISRCGSLFDIIWDGKRYVAASGAAGTGYAVTSTDGVTWEKKLITDVYLLGICFNGSTYVAVGMSGNICTSTDGENWVQAVDREFTSFSDCTTGNSRVLITGIQSYYNSLLCQSPDGKQWERLDVQASPLLASIYFHNLFILAARDHKIYRLNPDSNGLEPITSPGDNTISLFRAIDNNLFALCRNGYFFHSENLQQWKQTDMPFENVDINDIASNGKLFVTVGRTWTNGYGTLQGFIAVSGDLASWQRATTFLDQTNQKLTTIPVLEGIVWTRGMFFTYGAKGALFASKDGLVWKMLNAHSEEWINQIIDADGVLVGIGTRGLIISSQDGLHWEKVQPPTSCDLVSIAKFKNQLIVIGDESTIVVGTVSSNP
jgi:hypothetical protein